MRTSKILCYKSVPNFNEVGVFPESNFAKPYTFVRRCSKAVKKNVK